MISKHVNIQTNLTTRQYDFFQFHIGQFSYQPSCKSCLIFIQSPLRFHLSINFIFSQTCISHHGCEKYSNLWCSDKWKMDLQVKKLKVDISANPRKNCHWSLSSPQAETNYSFLQLRGRTKETYFERYCFKSTFLNINRRMHFLLRGPFE